MRFEEVIEDLRIGKCIFRDDKNWLTKNQLIFRPKPNMKISKFNSSEDFKIITEGYDEIILEDQILVLNTKNNLTAYSVTVEDVFAEDWQVIPVNTKKDIREFDKDEFMNKLNNYLQEDKSACLNDENLKKIEEILGYLLER